MKKQKDRKRIAEFLPSIVKEKGWEKQLDLHSIFGVWQELVSDEVAEYAQPLKIEKGVLWLEVENSSWMQQLQFEKLEILERVNEYLALNRLRDIKMVLPRKKDVNPYANPQDGKEPVEFVRPAEEKIAQFEKQAGCIEDQHCRKALMQFWYLANACRRNDKK